jgi:hypothetical protein
MNRVLEEFDSYDNFTLFNILESLVLIKKFGNIIAFQPVALKINSKFSEILQSDPT